MTGDKALSDLQEIVTQMEAEEIHPAMTRKLLRFQAGLTQLLIDEEIVEEKG